MRSAADWKSPWMAAIGEAQPAPRPGRDNSVSLCRHNLLTALFLNAGRW